MPKYLKLGIVITYFSMVNYLLQAGANARATDAQGNTPLHYAALKGRTNALDMVGF